MSERNDMFVYAHEWDNAFLSFTFRLMTGMAALVLITASIGAMGLTLFIRQIGPTPEDVSMMRCVDMCEERGVETWTMAECVCSKPTPESNCRYLCGTAGVCSLSAEGSCACRPSCGR